MPGDETEAILYYSEHILFHKLLAFSLIDLLLRLVQFLQADHLILRIIQTKMCVGIHGHTDVRMSHKVLKSLWVHSGSCHITAVGMPADMRRDVRKLYAEDVVVSLNCVLETVFPVQGYKRQAPVISEKESDVAINHDLLHPFRSVIDDRLEHIPHIIRHRELPCSGIRLCSRDNVIALRSPLQLMINVNDSVLHVEVTLREPAELADSHACMEKDVEDLVVLAIYIIVVNKLEEVLHLLRGNGFPGLFGIDDDPGQLETERILHQHVIVYRHLESRTKDTTDSFHGA